MAVRSTRTNLELNKYFREKPVLHNTKTSHYTQLTEFHNCHHTFFELEHRIDCIMIEDGTVVSEIKKIYRAYIQNLSCIYH
jgi:hypothetical protein